MDEKGRTYRTRASLRKRNRESENEESVDPQTTSLLNDILEGLSVENGEYVRIDENLIKRLKPAEKEPVEINPFKDCLDFAVVLAKGTPLTHELLDKYSHKFHMNPMGIKMADMLGNLPIEFLALKYSKMIAENWDYNIKMSVTPHVSNQEGAGLCWMHAATNVLRHECMKKFHVNSKFEISQSYLFFYDKCERSNLFLEYMWQMRSTDIRDHKIHTMASPHSEALLISDGGMYPFFTALAKKYGIVPKNIYGPSMNCRSSKTMNDILIRVLNRMMLPLFREGREWTRETFEKYKDTCNQTIYDMMVRFLGEPPKPHDTFDWTYKDVNGECHTIKNMTPEKFYRLITIGDEGKIMIVHDPRHPETCFMQSYVENGLNIAGGPPTSMINLPLDTFKRVICDSLKNDEAVWFACDVHQGFDEQNKTWDTERFDYDSVLGTPLEFDKTDMLETLVSMPVHAMTFNGVDVDEDINGKVVKYKKWRVFNSWGSESEEVEMDSGFFRMTDEYFDRYVTVAVVDMRYFEPEEANLIMENVKAGKTFTYSFTDAFGAVAMTGCNCGKSRN